MKHIDNPIVNWTLRDIFHSLVLSARRRSFSIFEKQIAKSMGCDSVLLTNLGRSALTLGLTALDIPPGSGILIPAILCPTVVHAILRAGHRPIIVDVNEDLHISPDSISPESLHGAKAILIAHLYGMSAPLSSLLDWANARRLLVIDDAAQAAGISLNGIPLGACGSMGILSFGPYKSLAGSRGGALVSKNSLLIENCRKIIGPRENLSGAIRRILGCFTKLYFPRAIQPVKSAIADFGFRDTITNQSAASTVGYPSQNHIVAPSSLECALAATIYLRSASIIKNRIITSNAILNLVSQYARLETIGIPNTPFLRIPVRIKSKYTAEQAVSLLRENGIGATRIYRPLHLIPSYSCYSYHSPNNSIESWNNVFLLPNPSHHILESVIHYFRKGLDIIGT